MAVPSSGPLQLRGDIALEVDGSATGTDVSLGTLSNSAGFTEPDTMSEFYGYSSVSAPSVTTDALSDITPTSMTANGNATADNGATITDRGFYFGTDSNYANNTKTSVGGTGTGTFTSSQTGLSPSTTYYATAYATNSVGEGRGATVSSSSAAYTAPVVTANVSTSNIYDTQMRVEFSYSQSYSDSIRSGFYMGTSTTATNNTFYDEGTSTGGTRSPARNITGLSGSTTYYIWGVIRDTQSPARFTEVLTPMKSQATLASVSYSTGWGGAQNLSGSEFAGSNNGNILSFSGSVGSSYNHVYYGWSGLSNGYSRSKTHSGAAQWETYSSAPNVAIYWAWRSDGTPVENRSQQSVSVSGTMGGYGGQSKALHSWYSVPNSGNRTLTGLNFSGGCSGFDNEGWPVVNNPPSGVCSGGYIQMGPCVASYSVNGHTYL